MLYNTDTTNDYQTRAQRSVTYLAILEALKVPHDPATNSKDSRNAALAESIAFPQEECFSLAELHTFSDLILAHCNQYSGSSQVLDMPSLIGACQNKDMARLAAMLAGFYTENGRWVDGPNAKQIICFDTVNFWDEV